MPEIPGVQTKSIPLEVKDIDTGKRTAVICHAVHDNLDRTMDVGRKGMFTKSWQESKDDISFYFNHDDTQAPGPVTDVFEEGNKAFTQVKCGTHTLGNDTLIMLDEKTIRWASYGYIPVRTNAIKVKEKSARELIEVKHIETSVLTKMPANPLAGVVSVTKSFSLQTKNLSQSEFDFLKQLAAMDDQALCMLLQLSGSIDETSDLYSWVLYQISRRADAMSSIRNQIQWNAGELKSLSEHIKNLENFCRNTKASDECIKMVTDQVTELKQVIIASYDTASTHSIGAPDASSEGNDSFRKQLLLLQMKMKATA